MWWKEPGRIMMVGVNPEKNCQRGWTVDSRLEGEETTKRKGNESEEQKKKRYDEAQSRSSGGIKEY